MTGGFWGNAGSGIDLTYSFIGSSSPLDTWYNYFRPEVESLTTVSSDLKSTVSDILALYSSVSLLNFTEVTDDDSSVGHLRFGTSTGSFANRAIFPHWYSPMAGDIWLNSGGDYFNYDLALMDGSYWNFTTNHEIGHALGLAHTHHAMSYEGRTYGSDEAYGTVHNALPYSVMSYAEYVGVEIDTTAHTSFFLPTTLMIDDIAALQHLYGINEQYNSGDNTYTLGSFNSGLLSSYHLNIDYIYASIWDAGGEDTFSWSDQSTIASINLNDGEFSCFGNISGPDDTNLDDSRLSDGDGILGIAYNAVIENAKGGSNIDTIVGNEADNKLYGGSGSGVKDTLTGGDGVDTFINTINDATTDINLADIITDFTDGEDKIGLEDKTVSELSWADDSGGTKIYETSTSKILFYLNSVSSSSIDENDFVQTDFV
ncbi:M10 family metallopeptidase [Alphaproteobacteria bacterium]|nr:M10 family metallopeptidase [Alphaproteobacteria bacterium]